MLTSSAFGRALFGATEYALPGASSSPGVEPAPASRTYVVGAICQKVVASQTPDEILNYSLDWSSEVGTDAIVTSTWSISPTGMSDEAEATAATLTTILLTGGIIDTVYQVRNDVVTESGLEYSATLRLYVIADNYL